MRCIIGQDRADLWEITLIF